MWSVVRIGTTTLAVTPLSSALASVADVNDIIALPFANRLHHGVLVVGEGLQGLLRSSFESGSES